MSNTDASTSPALPASSAQPLPAPRDPLTFGHPLFQRYQVGLFDLDGVVYVGGQVIPVAPPTLEAARQAGMRLGFVTNNAARTAQAVAQLLTSGGIPTQAHDVVTSAQAAAALLAQMLPTQAPVLVLGTDALSSAITQVGLVPVRQADQNPQALVQGFSPTMDWEQLTQGVLAINAGVPWVLTNDDLTIPIPAGIAPGNGSLAAVLRTATGVDPIAVAGKPNRTQMEQALRQFAPAGEQGEGARSEAPGGLDAASAAGASAGSLPAHSQSLGQVNALFVGDRLDTDMAGAAAVGIDSLAVLSGVSTSEQIVRAAGDQRPTYVADSILGLAQPLLPISALMAQHGDQPAACGGWQARVDSGHLLLSGHGEISDAVAAACAAVWPQVDAGNPVPDLSALEMLG